MKDLYPNTENASGKQPERLSEPVSAEDKKKNIDEMIAEFNKNNPVKTSRKLYRGVF